MTLFKNYLDKLLQANTDTDALQGNASILCWIQIGGGGILSDVALPLFLKNPGAPLSGITTVVYIAPGDSISLAVTPLGSPITVPYGEMFVLSLDGTQGLGVEADGGIVLDNPPVWTNVSTFSAIGSDLSNNGAIITSAAGGTFAVRFSISTPTL